MRFFHHTLSKIRGLARMRLVCVDPPIFGAFPARLILQRGFYQTIEPPRAREYLHPNQNLVPRLNREGTVGGQAYQTPPAEHGLAGNSKQALLPLQIERERDVGGVGMGVLSDGTPFLTQRGLAALCGVMNAHIGTISADWNVLPAKPRIVTIRRLLWKASRRRHPAHQGDEQRRRRVRVP